MRVIAGMNGGRKLQAPKGSATRPTPDRVKEALFSILGPKVVSARILDLFAGSGALGIEALSRGAGYGVFVDKGPQAVAALRHNLESLYGSKGPYAIMASGALQALHKLAAEPEPFDVVFVDPPYACALVEPMLVQVLQLRLLAQDGIIVAEHAGGSPSPPCPVGLQCTDHRRYGDVALSFYTHGAATPTSHGAPSP